MHLKVHTLESAPEGAQETLQGVQKAFGSIPNLYMVFAEAPAVLKAYRALSRAAGELADVFGERLGGEFQAFDHRQVGEQLVAQFLNRHPGADGQSGRLNQLPRLGRHRLNS